jgi:predicted nucleic acid-binding protein
MKILIDTNVILDALLSRAPYHSSAEKLFLLAAENKITATITANSITDIYYLLRKHLHNTDQAKQALLKLFSLFRILDITENDCKNALILPITDYEDALLVTCAKRNKVDRIITRNLKDFTESPVQTVAPDDFLTTFFQ